MLGHEPSSGHYLRVVATYAVLIFTVAAVTTGVVFLSKGYRVDIDDQEIVRTGLIRMESSPDALVLVDGDNADVQTPARLSLAEGEHEIQLLAEGYSDWYKEFDVEGGIVKWVTYPFLIPETVVDGTRQFRELSSNTYVSFSPLGKYMLSGPNAQNLRLTQLDGNQDPDPIDLTDTIDASSGRITDQIWAENDEHVLLEVTAGSETHWALVTLADQTVEDVTGPLQENGFNPLAYIQFRDGYVLTDRGDDTLWMLNLADNTYSILSTGASSFGQTGASVVWHNKGADDLTYWDQGETDSIPVLRNVNNQTEVIVSSLLGDTHVAYVTDGDVNVIVEALSAPYERRLGELETVASISPGGRYLIGKSDNRWHSYDLKDFDTFEFDQEHDPRELEWAGSHHLLSLGAGGVKLVEFDGYNTRQLTTSDEPVMRARLSNAKQAVYNLNQVDNQRVIERTPLRSE